MTMENVPFFSEVDGFVQTIMNQLGDTYEISCIHGKYKYLVNMFFSSRTFIIPPHNAQEIQNQREMAYMD